MIKKSKVCPKCKGQRVVTAFGGDMTHHGWVYLPSGAFNTAKADLLICCDCGYTEFWMPEDKLEKIYKLYRDDSN